MKYIYATIGILFWIFMNQLHAATPTVITGEQACKMRVGTSGVLGSTQYASNTIGSLSVSGESRINYYTIQYKGIFYRSGNSIYYTLTTSTGTKDDAINTQNEQRVNGNIVSINLYKYDCSKKSTTLITKENLKPYSTRGYGIISWIRGGYIIYIASDKQLIISERTGRVIRFEEFRNYNLIKEISLYSYQYVNTTKIRMNTFEGRFMIDMHSKNITKLK